MKNRNKFLILRGVFLLAISSPHVLMAGAPFPLAAESGTVQPTPADLPELTTVLEKALERAKLEEQNNHGFQEHYAYRRTKVTEERNTRGILKKREQRVSRHVPNPNEGAVHTTNATPAKAAPPTDARTHVLTKKDFPLDQEMLNRFQFTMAGREVLHGRPTLMLDFKPAAKELPVNSFKDHLLNKAAGRLWIDEEEFVVVQLNIYLTEGVGIMGHLAGYIKGLWYHFDRERTPDGYWFPKYVKWHAEGREFLVHKIMDHEEEELEVRKVR